MRRRKLDEIRKHKGSEPLPFSLARVRVQETFSSGPCAGYETGAWAVQYQLEQFRGNDTYRPESKSKAAGPLRACVDPGTDRTRDGQSPSRFQARTTASKAEADALRALQCLRLPFLERNRHPELDLTGGPEREHSGP